MTISIFLNHTYFMDYSCNGVGVYCKYVCKSLLTNHPQVVLKFWFYPINEQIVQKAYGFLKDQYPDRIFFHKVSSQYAVLRASQLLSIFCIKIFFKFLSVFNGPQKYLSSKESLIHKILWLGAPSHELSSSDVIYFPYWYLPLPVPYSGHRVIQLHDFYMFSCQELFTAHRGDITLLNNFWREQLVEHINHGAELLCTAEFTKFQQILPHLPEIHEDHIRVIPMLPLISANVDVSKKDLQSVKDKFQITGPYIFYASQNRPVKNLIVLCKALSSMGAEAPTLVTTGKIKLITETKKFIQEHPIPLIETGSVTELELSALYKGASMAVVPTRIEGYGMSAQGLEGMSMGIPVIHAISIGIGESLASVGLSFETADLNWFDCDDAVGLAEKIKEVLVNPLPHIQKQKHILAAYTDITWQDTAREYLKIFYKGLNTGKGGDSGKP